MFASHRVLPASGLNSFTYYLLHSTFGQDIFYSQLKSKKMRTKVVAIAAASLLTAGIGAHITHHCLLREVLAKNTAAPAPKDAKATSTLIAKR